MVRYARKMLEERPGGSWRHAAEACVGEAVASLLTDGKYTRCADSERMRRLLRATVKNRVKREFDERNDPRHGRYDKLPAGAHEEADGRYLQLPSAFWGDDDDPVDSAARNESKWKELGDVRQDDRTRDLRIDVACALHDEADELRRINPALPRIIQWLLMEAGGMQRGPIVNDRVVGNSILDEVVDLAYPDRYDDLRYSRRAFLRARVVEYRERLQKRLADYDRPAVGPVFGDWDDPASMQARCRESTARYVSRWIADISTSFRRALRDQFLRFRLTIGSIEPNINRST
jgi:hypothetical protein